jgi:hypothetical protein
MRVVGMLIAGLRAVIVRRSDDGHEEFFTESDSQATEWSRDRRPARLYDRIEVEWWLEDWTSSALAATSSTAMACT